MKILCDFFFKIIRKNEFFLNKNSHEIKWISQQKPTKLDFFEKNTQKSQFPYEIIPGIDSSYENPWGFAKTEQKPFGFLETTESVPVNKEDLPQEIFKFWKGVFDENENIKKFWNEGLKRKETPKEEIERKTKEIDILINKKADLEKIAEISLEDPYVFPRDFSLEKVGLQ